MKPHPTYTLTKAEKADMFAKFGRSCNICGVPQSMQSRSLAIDHCHTTGKIRGVLCSPCNTGLGFFRDSQANLLNAIQYLQRQGIWPKALIRQKLDEEKTGDWYSKRYKF